jgi:hypothetical protein
MEHLQETMIHNFENHQRIGASMLWEILGIHGNIMKHPSRYE